MVNCCVLYCTSYMPKKNYKNKNNYNFDGISYHEFPCDFEQRSKWMKNINRKNWIVSDRSRVCSKHFTEDDFMPGIKIKKLKKGVVPTVFEESRVFLFKSPKTGEVPTNQHSPPKMAISENDECVISLVEAVEDRPIDFVEETVKSEENSDYNHEFLDSPANEKIQTSQSKAKIESRTKQMQLERISRRMKNKNNRLLIQKLKKQIATMEKLVNQQNSTISELKQKMKTIHIEKIEVDAKENKLPAIMLLEQLTNYVERKPRWHESIIRNCSIWRSQSPKTYELCRNNLMKLPSRYVLK